MAALQRSASYIDMTDRNEPGDAMSQAEIGGGARIDSGSGLQRPGYVIRDFILYSVQGEPIQISNYRRRANLVLVFSGEGPLSESLLRTLAAKKEEFKQQDAIPILILAQQALELKSWAEQLLVLIDENQRVHSLYGAVDQHGRPVPVLYVTDRFGEIAAVYSAAGGAQLPAFDAVLKLLEFINHQCPECEPPEWPR
jgi:peroxiredoxin